MDEDCDDCSLPLTEIERRVLALVAQGMTNVQIARTLYYSVDGVKSQIERIGRKLDRTNRASIVAEAMRRGCLD